MVFACIRCPMGLKLIYENELNLEKAIKKKIKKRNDHQKEREQLSRQSSLLSSTIFFIMLLSYLSSMACSTEILGLFKFQSKTAAVRPDPDFPDI